MDLARGAGRILVEHFGRQIAVEYKDKKERDPVTQADKACQEYLVAEITKRFPEHGILGEETASKEEAESEARHATFCGCWTLWTGQPIS